MNNKKQTNLNHLPNESSSSSKNSNSWKDVEREDYMLLNAIKELIEDEIVSGREYDEILEYTNSSTLEEAHDKVIKSMNPSLYWNQRFSEEIAFGRTIDIVSESRFHLETFENELEDSEEFNEKLVETERKFDEEVEEHRKACSIGTQCRNFMKRMRISYVGIDIVKKVVEKFNAREKAIVWSSWKGLGRRKYYYNK